MSTKYNVGMIGYGLSAKVFHVPYLQVNPQFAIRAIVSRSGNEEVQKDHPEATVYHSAVDLFKDKGIDVVIVATPPHTHYELATQALEAGKHVIVEKPFAPTVAECNQLIELAKEKRLILTVYQNRRWDADFITLQRILAEGSVGRVVEFESHFDRYAPISNSTDDQPVLPGTGVVFDLGTHLIDQATVIFGSPDRVSAFLAAQQEGNHDGPRDACTVLLHYDHGLMVIIKASSVSSDSEQLRFWVRGSLGSYKVSSTPASNNPSTSLDRLS
ncbi:hypothetical protein NW754_002320 [Fusarium falciforme]|nr:hypothetical protein NW754_002320 [Fusarium falciforme]